jgi:hypothetical protein
VILQTPNRSSPLHREIWARTKKFVLPEEKITLKVIFDNVRNYLMCAAVVAAVAVLGPVAGNGVVVPWTLIVFAGLLIITNVLQSWFIIERWTSRIGRFQKEIRPGWGKLKRRLMRVCIAILFFPIMAGMAQGFLLLVLWALTGGK